MSSNKEENRIPTIQSIRWIAQSRQNIKKGGHVLFKFKLLDQTGLELRITDASFVCFDLSISSDGTPNDGNGLYFEIGAIPNGISSRKIWILFIVQLCYVDNKIIPIVSNRKDSKNNQRIIDLPFNYNEENEDSVQPISITKKNEIELYLRIFEVCENVNVPHFNLVLRAIDRRKKVESNTVTLVSRSFIVHDLDKTNRWIHFKNQIDIKKSPSISEHDGTISFPEEKKQFILPPDYISIIELCEEFIIHEHPLDINSITKNLIKTFFGSSAVPFDESSLNFVDVCIYIIESIGSESTETIQATLLKIINQISSHCPECSLSFPNFQDINRMSLLHHCCITGYIKICKYLISLHADVNLVDNDHNTPLHYAVEGGYKNLSSLLIFHSAKVDICNIFDETPISLALKDNRIALREMLEKSLSTTKHILKDPTESHTEKPLFDIKKSPKTPYLQLPPNPYSPPSNQNDISNSNDSDSIINSSQKKHSISSENIKRTLSVVPRNRAPSDPQKNVKLYPKKTTSSVDSTSRQMFTPLTIKVKKEELPSSWESILRSVGMKSNELITNDEIVNSIGHHIRSDSVKKVQESNENNLLRPCHPSNLVAKLTKISEEGESDVYIGLLVSRMERVLINIFSIQTQNPTSLYNEIHIMNLLKDNPRTLKIIDTFSHNHKAWIITEYLSGCTLYDLLVDRSFKLSEPILRYIMEEILLSLIYIHKNNIVYRNLELNNVFICNDGRIKLVDMSLAQLNPKMTPKGKSLSKISDFDYKMDLWSIGVIGIQLANHSIKNEPISVSYITNNPGEILEPHEWSEDYINFLSSCKEHYPSTQESDTPLNVLDLSNNLLSHNFLKGEKDSKTLVLYVETLIKKQKHANFPWCRRI